MSKISLTSSIVERLFSFSAVVLTLIVLFSLLDHQSDLPTLAGFLPLFEKAFIIRVFFFLSLKQVMLQTFFGLPCLWFYMELTGVQMKKKKDFKVITVLKEKSLLFLLTVQWFSCPSISSDGATLLWIRNENRQLYKTRGLSLIVSIKSWRVRCITVWEME